MHVRERSELRSGVRDRNRKAILRRRVIFQADLFCSSQALAGLALIVLFAALSKLPIPLSREKDRDFFLTTLEIPKFHRKSANFASKQGISREFPNSSVFYR
jgi:hypothetical protein